jgi:hypothetical protein
MPDPIEKTEELAVEAERGKSERTPWLVGRCADRVAALVVVVLAIVFGVYLLA